MTLKENIKIICFVLCWWLPTDSWAQTHFSDADKLYAAGNYERAAIEYDRAGFFAESENIKATALLHKADCYMRLGNYASAAFNLSHVNYSNINDSLVYECHYIHALASFFNNDFNSTLEQTQKIEFSVKNQQLVNNSRYLQALAMNELNRYDEAKTILHTWVNNNPSLSKTDAAQWIDEYYSKKRLPKLRKENTAAMLSIVPGLGHFYCHDYKEGIINAGFQVAFLAFGVGAAYYHYYATSLLVGYGLFNKFHSGAQHRMDFLVAKRNYTITRPFNDAANKKIFELRARQ